MRRMLFATAALLIFTSVLRAQHGTAPNGYYPMNYHGDTWTGAVTSVNDQTREITLAYTKGDKTEAFTGVLKAGLKAKRTDGSEVELKPSDFPIGTRLVVYYTPQTKKVEGQKVTTYEIFAFTAAPKESK